MESLGRNIEKSQNMHVLVNLVLGSLSRNCMGVGICKMDVQNDGREVVSHLPNYTQAYIYTGSLGEIVFEFKESLMHPETIKEYFRHNYFIIPEQICLNEKVRNALRIDEGVLIAPGAYKIQREDDKLIVSFSEASKKNKLEITKTIFNKTALKAA